MFVDIRGLDGRDHFKAIFTSFRQRALNNNKGKGLNLKLKYLELVLLNNVLKKMGE